MSRSGEGAVREGAAREGAAREGAASGPVYVSRLCFVTKPGHTHEVEEKLKSLRDLVAQAGGQRPRVLRGHYASLGAPDLIFEQEAPDLVELEREIGTVTADARFQTLSREISDLLAATPKREVYRVIA